MKIFWMIWLFSVMCASCIIPIQHRSIKQQAQLQTLLHPTSKTPPVIALVTISMVQTYIFLAIATYVGLWLMPSGGLYLWVIDHWLTGSALPFSMQEFWTVSLLSGLVMGVIVKLVDRYFYQPKLPRSRLEKPIKSRVLGFLSSFYGGVCEEVLMRLGIMTFVVYLAKWIGLNDMSYWIGIIVAAIAFGAAHLPTNVVTFGKSSIVIQWTMLLNGILGIQFGWLYWQYGLEAAIVSHFIVDIVLHVFFKDNTLRK